MSEGVHVHPCIPLDPPLRQKTCSYAERFHSQSALKKHTHLKLAFSTLYYTEDTQTDTNFVANSTIAVVSKAASVASHCSQSFLPVTMIAKTEACTF